MGLLAPLVARWALWGGCAVCAALGAFAGWQTLRLADARAALAVEQRDRAADRAHLEAAARDQADRFRATEQAWRDAQNENATLARRARDLAAQHADDAVAAAGRLRERAAVVAAACRPTARDPAAVAAGPAASSPGDLLADVLGRLDEAGRLVARFADAASISGEQCAADYEALRNARQAAHAGPQRVEAAEVAQP